MNRVKYALLPRLTKILKELCLEKNLSAGAADDELGRKLQDAEILVKKRAPKKKTPLSSLTMPPLSLTMPPSSLTMLP
jgi:hypothetical protein